MFFFLIKKAFFDAWDNLASVIVSNLSLFIVLAAGTWPMLKILESGSPSGFALLIIMIPLLFVVGAAASSILSGISDYTSASFSDIPAALKNSWKHGLYISVLATLFFAMTSFGMYYYSNLGTLIGLAAMAFLFWISLGVYLVLLWFFPVRNRLEGNFRKLLRKSGIVMLDNLGLSLFAGLIMVPLQMILWPITAFGGFGPGGIMLYMDGALRLQMFRYDWQEENPDARKKDVPWYALLIDEKEKVGKRTLKGMIFPWKE